MSNLLHYEKPTTSSRRGIVRVKKNFLWKGDPEKSLTQSVKNTGGRNNHGKITCQGRINTVRRKYRMVDFYRNKDYTGHVERIEYDPNRTAHIALIRGQDTAGKEILKYIIATGQMKPGMTVGAGSVADRLEGHCLKLMDIPVGSEVHNVELQPNKGGKLARSAGACVILVGKQLDYAELRLPSGETRKFLLDCRATIGRVSNSSKYNNKLGKAGNGIHTLHRRPKVRGVAKNPVDHCNGGKTSGGKVFTNFQGNMIKGQKTRSKKKFSNNFIVLRRNRSK